MSARLVTGALALLGGLLLASPALAQGTYEPPPPPADPGTVIVVMQPPPPMQRPPAYYPLPDPAPLPPEPEHGFSLKVSGGPAYQRVFGSSIVGAELEIAPGGVHRGSGWYGAADLFLGRMDHGLFTLALRPGGVWEARLGAVHLGLGLNFAFVGVQRATTSDMLTTAGFGASAFATVDLLKGERTALFLGLKMHADVLAGADAGGSAPILWGPSLALGWRYR